MIPGFCINPGYFLGIFGFSGICTREFFEVFLFWPRSLEFRDFRNFALRIFFGIFKSRSRFRGFPRFRDFFDLAQNWKYLSRIPEIGIRDLGFRKNPDPDFRDFWSAGIFWSSSTLKNPDPKSLRSGFEISDSEKIPSRSQLWSYIQRLSVVPFPVAVSWAR